jgi:uncharacterized membrane protein YphA (DoxX/SURF4 family)
MTKFIWALQILVAVAFLAVGTMKLTQARADIMAMGATYAQDFSDTQIKLIGAAEVAGAVGLIVPAATGILPVLTPIAGACLAVLMASAVNVHVSRGEDFVPPLALGLLALAVAVLRFRRR